MANKTGKGGFQKGVSGNPKGRVPGQQSFIDRAKHLIEQFNIAQIKEFTKDEKKFDALSIYDAMVMRRIVEAVSDNGRQSMDSLLDRLLGKPAQYIETKNDTTVEHKPISHTVEWVEECLGAGQTDAHPEPVSD